MRKYEVMYILKPDLKEEEIKDAIARLQGIITNFNGEIEKVEEMGKRRLAYEIKKIREGYYVLMNFKAEAKAVFELERVMKIMDEVIRYLIVKDEK